MILCGIHFCPNWQCSTDQSWTFCSLNKSQIICVALDSDSFFPSETANQAFRHSMMLTAALLASQVCPPPWRSSWASMGPPASCGRRGNLQWTRFGTSWPAYQRIFPACHHSTQASRPWAASTQQALSHVLPSVADQSWCRQLSAATEELQIKKIVRMKYL